MQFYIQICLDFAAETTWVSDNLFEISRAQFLSLGFSQWRKNYLYVGKAFHEQKNSEIMVDLWNNLRLKKGIDFFLLIQQSIENIP